LIHQSTADHLPARRDLHDLDHITIAYHDRLNLTRQQRGLILLSPV